MKSSRRQFLVYVSGISGYWMTKTGGEVTSDTTKVWDGGAKQPDTLAGPPQASDVVVTRVYDYTRDNPVAVKLRQLVGQYRTTISVTPTDANLVALGNPVTYPDALLTGLTEPEPDASSGDGAIIQLTFSVGAWR